MRVSQESVSQESVPLEQELSEQALVPEKSEQPVRAWQEPGSASLARVASRRASREPALVRQEQARVWRAAVAAADLAAASRPLRARSGY